MKIGKRIRELRKIKKIKLTELAEKAFISQSFLSEIENDRTNPSLDTLFSICKVLDVPLPVFFSVSPEDIKQQVNQMDYISSETKILIELIDKLPLTEKHALINYLTERLKTSN
ncbi:helix-turn-helix transcriptional regulator [Bacillaceae bacterium CLA-AA-H227]|uniref:Helix-turn-helix transcriptional regulator n=1 Tax=Robertmurraya yapensis (ex Hitch et al 2024) TaxID=3133160 RepID=A0ACC6SGH9_9BACI